MTVMVRRKVQEYDNYVVCCDDGRIISLTQHNSVYAVLPVL